ncbi:MAG: hypothetical protein M3Z32_11665 [Acidobacteriota bacterium]|nr:hypothetical protein [Acidobacteriota bacterium]
MRLPVLPAAAVALFVSATVPTLPAQSSIVSFRVFTEPLGARFSVDGIIYTGDAKFQWPTGSKHLVRFIQDALPPAAAVVNGVSQATFAPVQLSPDGAAVYSFGGFSDAAGLLSPGSDPNQFVTADASVPYLKISVSLSYRVLLNFLDLPGSATPPSCGAPGNIPAGEFRVGLVYINSQCYWNSAILYYPAGSTLQLNAFPYPGFVFTGWSGNLGEGSGYLRSYVLNGPVTLAPMFQAAKRVRFETVPLGLQVLVDRTPAPTLSLDDPNTPCPHNEGLPVTVPSTVAALCRGDFDFAPGSAHMVGAVSPQYDLHGNIFVFDSWGAGQGQNAIYTADSNAATPDKVIVTFVPGVQASFVTSPPGLKLNIDGRDSGPSYNFTWASGSTHQLSAPAEQFDSQGRKFTFRSWSNGAPSGQTLTVDAGVSSNVRLIANYDGLGRVVVQSSPGALKIQVDGADCSTPCTVDRVAGTSLRVTAPSLIALDDDTRLEFSNWSDGAPVDHQYTLTSESRILTATYSPSYRLRASSDPGNSVKYTFDPATPDMFYPSATQVNVTAESEPGFKFRRWAGDLAGTVPSGILVMSRPHSIVALSDRIPYIAPAGVRNAAGDTPDGAVAPGSLIAITGESLATREETGRVNPLAQTIAGVTVTVSDRLLPLVSVAPQQLIAQLPSDLPDGDYTLQVHSAGQPEVTGTFKIARNAPGLFSSKLSHEDGTPMTAENPAKRGEMVTVLGTGFGPYTARVIDGFFPFQPPPAIADSVQVFVGDVSVTPAWSGAAAGRTGLTATRFKITDDIPGGGNVALTITVNGKPSNTVLLPIE